MKSAVTLLALFISISIFSQNINDVENLLSSQRFDDAYNSLMEIKKNSPQNPYIYYALGETVLKSYINDPYSETKKVVVKKAMDFFNEGIKIDSLNSLNYVGLGILDLFRNNDTLNADYYFTKAKNLIPTKKKKINDIHIKTIVKLITAELYSNSPRYSKSEQYYQKLLVLRPKLHEIYIAEGDVLLAQGKASEAIAQYKKALFIENTALTNALVAKIYFSARNYDEAKVYYESALKIDSMFAPAYKGLGEVYYRTRNNNMAKLNYAKFLELTGNNIPAKINYVKALYKSNDYDGTIANADEVLKVDSSKTYLYRIIAYSYVDKSEPDMLKALNYLQKFISKSTEDELIVKDYSYYSKILLGLNRDSNDIQKGVEMLEKAYLADTTDNDMIAEIIKTSYKFKVYDIEIKYLLKKINARDNTPSNYMLLGKAYYYNKNFVKADSIFSIINAMDSTMVEAFQWKAYSLSSLDPDLKDGLAKPVFEKIIDITNNEANNYKKERYDAYSYLGSYYMFTSKPNFDKSVENIKNSIEIDPTNAQWQLKGYYTLAFAYYKSKQWLLAKNAYETILKLKPDDTNAPKALKDIDKYLNGQK